MLRAHEDISKLAFDQLVLPTASGMLARTEERLLTGSAPATLDGKSRFYVPRKFGAALTEQGGRILVVDPVTLWVFPEAEFHSLIIRAASAEPTSGRPLEEVRKLLNRAELVYPDSVLRLCIPSNLRSQFTPNAGSKLRLVGQGNFIEVTEISPARHE